MTNYFLRESQRVEPSRNGNQDTYAEPERGDAWGGDHLAGDLAGAGEANAVRPKEAADDPHRLARLFINQRCLAEGYTLRFYRDAWHRWDKTKFQELQDAELRAELTQVVKAEFDRLSIGNQELGGKEKHQIARRVTKSLLTNVELALASQLILPSTVEAPAFWNGKNWTNRNLIALSNGLLDLDAFFSGKPNVLVDHTPHWFSNVCLPYPFDAEADCLRWQNFREYNLEDDKERIALLQEWFGYCVTPDTSRQKFMILEGEGSNGKSVACAALEAMLGIENCSHVPLEVFGERFQLTPTLGKLANICAEVGELDKTAEGFLKSFTSGDPMGWDRKFKEPINAVPTARLVLATNNRPRFSDRSGGLWRRMILMPFRVAIAENDPGRILDMHKPEWWEKSGELPGILNWALAGLERLRKQNHFTRPEICDKALSDYRIENNPARMFLLENYLELLNENQACATVYATYREWCKTNGYSALADRAFGREVHRVFPKTERKRKMKDGKQQYVYEGLDTNPD